MWESCSDDVNVSDPVDENRIADGTRLTSLSVFAAGDVSRIAS